MVDILVCVVTSSHVYMGVSKNRGGPPKWMVKIMETPIKMDDLGVPLFLETLIYRVLSRTFASIYFAKSAVRTCFRCWPALAQSMWRRGGAKMDVLVPLEDKPNKYHVVM